MESYAEVYCSRCGIGPLKSWTMAGAGSSSTDFALCESCSAGGWTPHEAVLDELMAIVGHDGSYRDLPEIVRRLVEADDAHGRTP